MCAAVALLGGCGQSQLPIGSLGAMPQSRDASIAHYKVLYRFKGGKDGAFPAGGLLNVKGTLYGTTELGGVDGTGTVFALDTATGKESVIASSLGNPSVGGPLLNINGTLYGAGREGGRWNEGAIFEVDIATHKKKTICDLRNHKGQFPNMGLIEFNGALYGTTYGGGDVLQGAVFACDPSTGKSHVVDSFEAGANGAGPTAGLTPVNGELYGTTQNGGKYYYGTIFKLSTNGKHHVLYSFGFYTDGAWPIARLINVNDTLYGTASFGGANGKGVIFKTGGSGAEEVLYSFKDTPDGAGPAAAVTYVQGSLYGTTQYGGSSTRRGCGCGTIFQLTASGKETVLHRFTGGKDGASPMSDLVDVKGTLYGTTTDGGGPRCSASGGCGTIFEITP